MKRIIKITAEMYFVVDQAAEISAADMLRSGQVICDELDEDARPNLNRVSVQEYNITEFNTLVPAGDPLTTYRGGLGL